MINLIKSLVSEKKVYKEQLSRVDKLPKDYQFVFKKISEYIWNYSDSLGLEMLKTQELLISLFEEGAANKLPVLEITGEDVAKFSDDLIFGTKKWTDHYERKLNKKIK